MSTYAANHTQHTVYIQMLVGVYVVYVWVYYLAISCIPSGVKTRVTRSVSSIIVISCHHVYAVRQMREV